MVANKVTHVINCAGAEVANHWEPIGVKYLTYAWEDSDSSLIFDPHDSVFQTIYEFIESTMLEGESVLLLSLRGKGRCCLLAAAYAMRRYRWTSSKALDFMRNRQPAMDLNPGFLRQLQSLEGRLSRAGLGPKTRAWSELNEEDEEENIVANTYLNAQSLGIADYLRPLPGLKVNTLKWADGNQGDQRQLEDIAHPSAKNPIEMGCAVLKSCLKGSLPRETRVPLQMLKIRSQKVLATSDYANKLQSSSLKVALEYGKVEEGPRTAKKTLPRPMSASKRENSPITTVQPRASSAKRESPRKPPAPLPERKRVVQREGPRTGPEALPPKPVMAAYSKSPRPVSTPTRQRDIPKGPVKVMSTGSIKKAVWK